MASFSGSVIRRFLSSCSLVLLAACSAGAPNNEGSDISTPTATEAEITLSETATETAMAERSPGLVCYQTETDTLSGQAQLMWEEDGSVLGGTSVTIQDPENSYYTSYRQQIDGEVVGSNQLEVQIITEIENDVQNSSETWTLTDTTIDTGREVYTEVDCALLPDLDASESAAEDEPTVHIHPVEFAPGTTGTLVEGGVIRGERDRYLLNAQANQLMTLSLISAEDNAVLEVKAPDGLVIESETTETSTVLPQTGEYQILVGGTRGNATYSLEIGIE